MWSNERSMDELPEKIGRYKILSKIGEGGFGAVFKGLDPNFERVVAIKVMHPGLFPDDKAKQRLFREGQLGGKLQHSLP